MTLGGCHLRRKNHYAVIAASKVVVVVSEVVAEIAFRMKLPGIHDVDVSALCLTHSLTSQSQFELLVPF